MHLPDAIPSSDRGDFQFEVKMDRVPESVWRKKDDSYSTVNSQPYYQLCKTHLPHYALVRLVKQDFVHNPLYHRLNS